MKRNKLYVIMVALSYIFLFGFVTLGNKCDTDKTVESTDIKEDTEEEAAPAGEEEEMDEGEAEENWEDEEETEEDDDEDAEEDDDDDMEEGSLLE